MKTLILFVFSTLLLVGCTKEAQINSKLKGTWQVNVRNTYWTNGYSYEPYVEERLNIGTLVFDKKGKGVLTIPDAIEESVYVADTVFNDLGEWVTISSHYETQYHDFICDIAYINDGFEKLKFETDSTTSYYNLTWSWDKKSFTAFNRGLNYGGNNFSNNYKETIFTFIKEK